MMAAVFTYSDVLSGGGGAPSSLSSPWTEERPVERELRKPVSQERLCLRILLGHTLFVPMGWSLAHLGVPSLSVVHRASCEEGRSFSYIYGPWQPGQVPQGLGLSGCQKLLIWGLVLFNQSPNPWLLSSLLPSAVSLHSQSCGGSLVNGIPVAHLCR